MPGAATLLTQLEQSRLEFGGDVAARKCALLDALRRLELRTARQVLRLHDALCFMRAYPDDAEVLQRVEQLLADFPRRRDLARHRRALAGSGIAGTAIEFRFFWPQAKWLAGRWGAQLSIVWRDFEGRDELGNLLPLLTHFSETPALDELAYTTRQWVTRLAGPHESDASWLVRRFDALRMDSFGREKLYDRLDPPLRLAAGPDTPSRTAAHVALARVVFQAAPLSRARPDIAAELGRAPLSVRPVSRAEGQRLIDLARSAMVTRNRDLDVFSWGDPDDVRLADCGGGLQFAVIGAMPERRLLMEAVYAFLTLKNGVPIGYVLNSALYGSAEIAYNVFENWRGAEAGAIYGRVLATVRHLFNADSFTIYPYQLGDGNKEGLESGAWWFYQKLGFRPRDPEARALMELELKRMQSRSSHRSSIATLKRLARHNLYYHSGRERDDVIGLVPLPTAGLAITALLASRFGSDRERGARVCADEAARLLGAPSRSRWSEGEQLAWHRWSPLVLVLPGVANWTTAEKRALVEVVKAKGGRRESEFVRRFDGHRRLRDAVRKLTLREDAANP